MEDCKYRVEMDDPETFQRVAKSLPVSVGCMKTVRKATLGLDLLKAEKIPSMLMETMEVSHINCSDLCPSVEYENPYRAVKLEPGHDEEIGNVYNDPNITDESDRTYIVQSTRGSKTREVTPSDNLNSLTVSDFTRPIRQCMTDVLRGMDRDTLKLVRDHLGKAIHDGSWDYRDRMPQGSGGVLTLVGCKHTIGHSWIRIASVASDILGYGQKAQLIMLEDPITNMLGEKRENLLRNLFLSGDGSPLLYAFQNRPGWMDILSDMNAYRPAENLGATWCEMTAGVSVRLERAGIIKLNNSHCEEDKTDE